MPFQSLHKQDCQGRPALNRGYRGVPPLHKQDCQGDQPLTGVARVPPASPFINRIVKGGQPLTGVAGVSPLFTSRIVKGDQPLTGVAGVPPASPFTSRIVKGGQPLTGVAGVSPASFSLLTPPQAAQEKRNLNSHRNTSNSNDAGDNDDYD